MFHWKRKKSLRNRVRPSVPWECVLLYLLRICHDSLHCSVCTFILSAADLIHGWMDNQIDTHYFNISQTLMCTLQIILPSSAIAVIGPKHQFVDANLVSLMLITALCWPLLWGNWKKNLPPALIKKSEQKKKKLLNCLICRYFITRKNVGM